MARSKPPKSLAGKPEPNWFRLMDQWTQGKDADIQSLQAQVSGAVTLAAVQALLAGGTAPIFGTQVQTAEADIRHGQRKLMLPAVMFQSRTNDYVTLNNFPQPENVEGARHISAAGASPCPVWCPIPLTVGDRIVEVDVYVDGNVSGTPVLKVWKLLMTAATGTAATQIGATITGTNTATIQTLARTGLTETIADATEYWLSCALGGGTEAVRGGRVIFDRPGP